MPLSPEEMNAIFTSDFMAEDAVYIRNANNEIEAIEFHVVGDIPEQRWGFSMNHPLIPRLQSLIDSGDLTVSG